MKKIKRLPIVTVCVALILGIFVTALTLVLEYNSKNATLRQKMHSQTNQIEANVLQAMQQVYYLRAFVLGANGDHADLSLYGSYFTQDPSILNVLLAPGGVVSQVYPLKGNEQVLGLDLYSSRNQSNSAALEARDSTELIVSTPYTPVQGGQVISGRMNIPLPQEDGSVLDWGLISVSLLFPDVLQNTETDFFGDKDYCFRLSMLNEETSNYEPLFEHNYLEGHERERLLFTIYRMHLQLEAYPASEWFNPLACLIETLMITLFSLLAAYLRDLLHTRREHLHRKATRDALTGIFNRDTCTDQIEKLLVREDFIQGVFLLMDVDHFKQVNDTLGHLTGDRVLMETAQFLSSICRNNDLVCRLGGDEFVLFLPCVDSNVFLQKKLEQICLGMRRTIRQDQQEVSISCSIGVALAPKHGTTFKQLYQNADLALYKAKEDGRDCFVIFEG